MRARELPLWSECRRAGPIPHQLQHLENVTLPLTWAEQVAWALKNWRATQLSFRPDPDLELRFGSCSLHPAYELLEKLQDFHDTRQQ